MPLVTTKEMFKKAYEGGYAIGAFNVNNMEIVQGIADAAIELNSPIILQVSAGARKYAKHNYLVKLVEAVLVEAPDLPIALHLDHGADFEICKSCIDGGFTSVMIDGSHHDFETNIELTKKVVEYAHERGVVVEAELGRLAGIEDAVNVSDADAAIINEHGGALKDAIGVPEEQLRQAARSAVCKINIDSDLRLGMTAGIREVMWTNPAAFDPREYLKVGRANVKTVVMHKIKDVLGSEGKA
ncbi:MAG: fructose-bisphosphate aldolase [Lachnospiraceae bacterium]|nr:fructose-bisphosphate aldolase [Lachnospiraceae bacterium]